MVQVGSLEFFVDDRYVVNDELPVAIKDISQYTGLKDKNGKEIYDGDVVKFHYFYASGGLEGFREAEHELTGVVKWGSFGWGVEAIRGEHWEGYTGYNAGEGDANFMELLAMNESGIHEESFEVIGNIWENPELLTPS